MYMFCLFVLQQFDFCLVGFFFACLFALFEMSIYTTLNKYIQIFFRLYSPRIHNFWFLHIDFLFLFFFLLLMYANTRNFQSKLLPSSRFNSFFSLLSDSIECIPCFFKSSCMVGLLCTMANDLVGWLSWKICELANTAKISGAKNGTLVWIWR